MKSIIGGLVMAAVLVVAGLVVLGEARRTDRLADAHQRLATLHYDAEDDLGDAVTLASRLPVVGETTADEIGRYRATVTYWRARYEPLTAMTDATGGPAPTDPELLFVAANAAFRASAVQSIEKKAAIERLDGVIQAYADVLRRSPDFAAAAFNFEFVSRMRDLLAKAQPARATKDKDRKAAAKPADISVDLPAGPTVHGRPGGPPEGTDMSDFKTITPMRFEEREEQMEPGRGRKIRRKG